MAACRPNLAALSHACQVCSLAQNSHLPMSVMIIEYQKVQDELRGGCVKFNCLSPALKGIQQSCTTR